MRSAQIILAALILAGCQRPVAKPLAIGGTEVENIVRSADDVTVSLLASNKEYRPSVSDYEILEEWRELAPEVRTELREIFLKLRPKPGPAKACIPDYRVRIHFPAGADSVDVLLCLDCRIMAVYHNTKAFGVTNFDDVAPQLIAMAKEMLPDDPAIQAIMTPH
ncbi:MAG: hypothetical protein Q8K78_16855 [Planctomycetaceae bacterium]|nr:hypothetical protein [Planctomycetaceae bacterium]